jgi:hypothetical protein
MDIGRVGPADNQTSGPHIHPRMVGGGTVPVASGPFRISRNPIYSGMLIRRMDPAVLLGSLTAFLFPVLFFLPAGFTVVPMEEKDPERTLGERFAGHKRRVRRRLWGCRLGRRPTAPAGRSAPQAPFVL